MAQFTVDPAALREHAAAVRRIAEGVARAADAAKEVGIGGTSAYGLLCSPLIIPALHGFFGDAVDLVEQAAHLGDAYADGLAANSDVYESVDADATHTLSQLRADVF